MLLRVSVRYKGLNLEKSSCNYPVRKSGKFQSSGIVDNMLMLGIIISLWIIISQGMGYCSLSDDRYSRTSLR